MTNFIRNSSFSSERIGKFFFVLFIISIFFPVRYVFPTTSSFATGLYSDFTSISLYSSDIFLFIAFLFILWSNRTQIKELVNKNRLIGVFICWLLLTFLWQIKPISGLNIWFFAKIIELVLVSYGTTRLIFSNKSLAIRHSFLVVFIALGTLQSTIGLLQFINQSPIGLNAVGEQVIYPNLWGVAKIVSSGTTYIRSYGTFPHPNPFSAFLVTTVFINLYLLNVPVWKRITKFWLNLALFINILGLATTFSRGAFLAFAIGLTVYFGLLTYKLGLKHLLTSIGKVALAILIAFLLFKPFLLTRTTFSDQATVERKIYNQTALNIIKDKPIFGVGIGESVLHMEQYLPRTNFYQAGNEKNDTAVNKISLPDESNSKKLVRGEQPKLKPWQIQPIHNYFLLSAAELGIVGAIILALIFIGHLSGIWKLIKNCLPSETLVKGGKLKIGNYELWNYRLVLFTILLCFLILMNFDHYFYTLQQTQMLLWIVLGLIAAEIHQEKIPE